MMQSLEQELVSEIGACRSDTVVPGQCYSPQQWIDEELQRRHANRGYSSNDGCQHELHEAHVVKEWEPADECTLRWSVVAYKLQERPESTSAL